MYFTCIYLIYYSYQLCQLVVSIWKRFSILHLLERVRVHPDFVTDNWMAVANELVVHSSPFSVTAKYKIFRYI